MFFLSALSYLSRILIPFYLLISQWMHSYTQNHSIICGPSLYKLVLFCFFKESFSFQDFLFSFNKWQVNPRSPQPDYFKDLKHSFGGWNKGDQADVFVNLISLSSQWVGIQIFHEMRLGSQLLLFQSCPDPGHLFPWELFPWFLPSSTLQHCSGDSMNVPDVVPPNFLSPALHSPCGLSGLCFT